MATAKDKPAKASKKVAPRTKGTPAKPPKPRKVAAAPKPKAPAKQAAKPAPPRAASPRAALAPVWVPAPDPEPQWLPAPDPPSPPAPPQAPLAFDPATGAWVHPGEASSDPSADPAAYRRGAVRSILLNVMLGIDLALLGLNFLFGIVVGIILVFAPGSAAAKRFEDTGITSPEALAWIVIVTFLLSGAIPFLWVLGTRVRPWEGTKRYLQLRFRWRDWGLGVLLVPMMIISVMVLSVAYDCAIHGCRGLTASDDGDDEGGECTDDLLCNLTWPVAVIVALCAGIGEEILFRGVLRRPLGVWGQGIAFGLAHAGNGFPPQVLFAFGLGVVFGHLAQRGWSLVTLMVAHTLYDFTLLALYLLFPELG